MLSELSVLAEIVAAAAVVLSLVFVGLQIRETNRQARLTNWRGLLDALRAFKGLTNDLSFAEMVERGHRDFGALESHEQRAFGLYLEQGIHVLGNFGKHRGRNPPGYKGLDAAIEANLRDLVTTPGARAWWAETRGRKRLMAATAARIDKLQAETPEAVARTSVGRLGVPSPRPGRR